MGDDATIHKARVAMEAGCVGLIFGRNMWQRKEADALSMASRMHDVMTAYGQDTIMTTEERVNAAIDKVRPGIAADGGEVWLIKVEDGIAYVQMLGACGGCPASVMTLKGAIEAIVVAEVPEVREVVSL